MDISKKYSLILYFDPNNANTRENIRNRLLQLSPNLGDRLDTILKHGKVILKKNAHVNSDQRIVALFEGTAAVCRFENTVSPQTSFRNIEESVPSKNTAVQDDHEMICPKCNRSQKEAPECSHCGVIIAKVRPREPIPPIRENPLAPELVKRHSTSHSRAVLKYTFGPHISRILVWLRGNSSGNKIVQQWSQRSADAILRCVVVFFVAVIMEIGLLFFTKYGWVFYTSTPVGQYYLEKFATQATSIQHVMQSDSALLGFQVVITVIGLCLLVGLVGQLTNMIRLFYLPFGFVGHTVLWGLPLTALSAWHLLDRNLVTHFYISCMVTLLPTLLLLSSCIHLAQTVAPELGTSIRIIQRSIERLAISFETVRTKTVRLLGKMQRRP